jgi:hypothetical protein
LLLELVLKRYSVAIFFSLGIGIGIGIGIGWECWDGLNVAHSFLSWVFRLGFGFGFGIGIAIAIANGSGRGGIYENQFATP